MGKIEVVELSNGRSLTAWLDYIQAIHSKSIAMDLDRVSQVATALQLKPEFLIITVGGTNGKGSTCAMLERIYHEAGYKVGCYTSPHLLRYNERVRISCVEVDDASLCSAFAAVDEARDYVPLTYFEIGTLAAVWHFMRCNLDVVILEVGLGGRLDAVNVFDPACAIVTGVDLDHMDFLGETKEQIGFEKAGIYRQGVPAICGDVQPPSSLLQYAADIKADLKLIGRDFFYTASANNWNFQSQDVTVIHLPKPGLVGDFQLNNAACVLQAIDCLQQALPISESEMQLGLKNVTLKGRFQVVHTKPKVVLDVAHNPQASLALVKNLHNDPCSGRTLAVFAMLSDKDVQGVIDAVATEIDAWYVADIDHARGAKAQALASFIKNSTIEKNAHQRHITNFSSVVDAYKQACLEADENDRIIVFGSFFTVADVMTLV